MSNVFKSQDSNQDDNVSKSSSSSSLSTNQLMIKPIKSLSSNATGSGRNKVELKPGCSLMDWIRLTNSGKDFTCGSFGTRRVTGTELAQHNKLDDAWTSIQGNVFNITPYFNFHPGGVDELRRAAGKESTQLFKQIHAWVNWNSMLQKCRVGHLIPGEDVQIAELDKETVKKEVVSQTSKKEVEKTFDAEIFEKNLIVLEESESLYQINVNKRFNLEKPMINLDANQVIENELTDAYWIDDMELFDLFFQMHKAIKEEDLMIDITEERTIKVKIYLVDSLCYVFNCRLPTLVRQDIKFSLLEDDRLLKITLCKFENELWAGGISRDSYEFDLLNQTSMNVFYRLVKLDEKRSLTHDVYQFKFKIPDGLFIPVKFGNHLALRVKADDELIFRYYTVVPGCFLDDDENANQKNYEDRKELNFVIKVYQDGQLTSRLGQLRVGDSIEISDPFPIDFSIENVLANKSTIYLLAAGTGLTPMLSVLFLSRLISKTEPLADKQIHLIFCNKTADDIILKDKLDQLKDQNTLLGFKLNYRNILSRPASDWKGLKGRLNDELIKQLISFNNENEFLFLCGPDEFNLNALSILDTIFHLKSDSYFVFSS